MVDAATILDPWEIAVQTDAIIRVDREFSRTPGGRLTTHGPYSGEEFRRKVLLPAIRDAQRSGGRVTVLLDGTAGYPGSFLEEAFGGLVREGVSASELRRILVLVAEAERYRPFADLAWKYIDRAHLSS